eukprot:1755446-Prymnesium_polylepis.1
MLFARSASGALLVSYRVDNHPDHAHQGSDCRYRIPHGGESATRGRPRLRTNRKKEACWIDV